MKKNANRYIFSAIAVFAALIATGFFSSCATSGTTTAPEKSAMELKQFILELEILPGMIMPLYYSDIIFIPENKTAGFILYDAEADLYYVPGIKSETITAGNTGITAAEAESVKVDIIQFDAVGSADIAGMSLTGKGIITLADRSGSVYQVSRNSTGAWETKKLFSAFHGKAGRNHFTAMAADKKHIYLYSQKDAGIYRYSINGIPDAFISADVKNDKISAIDIKSSYLYLLFESGLIVLADYEKGKAETAYKPYDKYALKTFISVRQGESNTDIILERKGSAGSRSYPVFPLSSQHRMRIEDGFIKKAYPPVSGCSYVLADSSGNILFPLKSNLINLDKAVSAGIVTVTGMILDIDGTKILNVSSIDN